MEVSGDSPPFWPPPSDARRRRSPSSPLLPAPILIILLPIIGLLVIFLVVPMLLSAAQHIFRPNSVKKSWDSVNILLVSFAILCGVLARRQDDGSAPSGGGDAPVAANDSHNGTVEFEASSYGEGATASGVGRLKRNSSSYPDLRQNLLWETGDNRFRFFDDFEINRFRSSATTSDFKLHGRGSEFEKADEVKEIPVDTFVLRTPPPPPPPPPPPLVVGLKPRRTYETISQREKVICQNAAPATPPAPPPPPPPSPSMRVKSRLEMRSGKLERRKSNAAKEIKMVLASIYNPQRKRKRKQRTQNQGEMSTELGRPFSYIPPPPPPPPPSMFHNLFKKGNKSRKVHSAHAPPPHTVPPPSSKRSSKAKPTQSNMGRPPLPTTSSSIVCNENAGNNGGESPLAAAAPPPFKMAETKKGDLVGSGSPDVKETELVSSWSSGEVGGVFCPSPDVNMKADTFIARLRDGWRLEKMNSLREKTRI